MEMRKYKKIKHHTPLQDIRKLKPIVALIQYVTAAEGLLQIFGVLLMQRHIFKGNECR